MGVVILPVLVVLAAIIWSATSWQKVAVGRHAELLFFGKRTGVQKGEGWQWIYFRRIFNLLEVETRVATLELVMTDLFARSGTSKAGEPVERVPRVRLKASGVVEYLVNNTTRFLGLGGIGELKKLMEGVAYDVLRQEFQGRDLGEILDKEHQKSFTEAIRDRIREKADLWGVWVNDFFLRPLKVEDENVEQAMQALFRERAEREAEVFEANTVVRQAAEFVRARMGIPEEKLERWQRGIFKDESEREQHKLFCDQLDEAIRQTQDWRIRQDAVRSEKGAVVILPAGMEMSYRSPRPAPNSPNPTGKGGR